MSIHILLLYLVPFLSTRRCCSTDNPDLMDPTPSTVVMARPSLAHKGRKQELTETMSPLDFVNTTVHAPLMNNSIDDNNDNQVELMYYPPHSTIYPVDNPAYDIVVTTTSTTTARKNKLQMHDIQWSNKLTVFVNGSAVTLINPNPSDLLSTFIRDSLGLKGTKLGCEEGGCGWLGSVGSD